MKKIKLTLAKIWAFIVFFYIPLTFPIGGKFSSFLGLLFTIGGVLLIGNLFAEAEQEDRKELLEKAKSIYSLNYSNLKHIYQIELTEEGKYRLYLKDNPDYSSNLLDSRVPKTQEQLEFLDNQIGELNERIKK